MRSGWHSTLGKFVTADPRAVLEDLRRFIKDASPEQVAAWHKSIDLVQDEGRGVIEAHPTAESHGSLWEYELPREGGRRPDVILLQDSAILVIEFKNKPHVNVGDIDQVAAYARDLHEYHSECHELPLIPILLYLGKGPRLETAGVTITTPNDFGKLVLELARKYFCQPPKLDLDRWIKGRYEPLPGIVEAARLLYNRQPLPFIRRAYSSGIPQTVDYILSVCEEARLSHQHHLVMLTGVPGAGKTLVGLQVVHSEKLAVWMPDDKQHLNPASFLSGNGPLVAVLQDALKSKSFVQDMHRFIREFGIEDVTALPHERVIVFDEAQRAWTRSKVKDFYGKKDLKADLSEPEMLIRVAQRMSEGCVILALIGTGQEIHTGEESGIQGWIDAVANSGRHQDWAIHAPPRISESNKIPIFDLRVSAQLDLNITIRSHAAEHLHDWVSGLLDEPLMPENKLFEIAETLQASAFPILLTRDLNWAKEYARSRFHGETNRRYGLLASSKARNLNDYHVDNRYDRFFPTASWFNAEPENAKSCCQLVKPAQEFHCQGLELDLPIVCWGDDFWWDDRWDMRPARYNPLVANPFAFRKNTYRVLMTRGREGLIIFVPPDDIRMEATAKRLIRCGALPVESRKTVNQTTVQESPIEPIRIISRRSEFCRYDEVAEVAFKTALPYVALLAAGPFANGFLFSSLAECKDAQWLRVPFSLGGQNRFIVKANGDSMVPTIKPDDLLVFEYHRSPRKDGQIVIVNASEIPDSDPQSAIKRLWQTEQNWVITSDNPSYKPTTISKEHLQYPILGVFVGKIA
jgi:phage repressor protein C with HTH and peptisase S24 domain